MSTKSVKARLQRAEGAGVLEALLEKASGRERARVQVVLLALQSGSSAELIARDVGVSRATVFAIVSRYRAGGIEAVLTKSRRGHRLAKIGTKLGQEIRDGLTARRWTSIRALREWLRSRGVSLSESGVHYWVSKLTGRKAISRAPRKKRRRRSVRRRDNQSH